MKLEEQVDAYVLSLEKDNKSNSTIKAYKSAVLLFLKSRQEHQKDPFTYDKSDILEFLEEQYTRTTSKSTIKILLTAINSFSFFIGLDIEIKLKKLPFIMELKNGPSDVVVLSEDIQSQMYKYAQRVWKKRDITIMLVFLETGIKLAELASLNKKDLIKINDVPYLTIHAKFPRTLPISEVLYSHILDTYKTNHDSSEALFVAQLGKRISNRSISRCTEIHGNITTQMLRDTYVYNLINHDTDTYLISQLVGIEFTDALIKKFYNKKVTVHNEFYEAHI